MERYKTTLYQQAIDEGKPEKIYWWEAIINCDWHNIDKVLEARRITLRI